MFCLALCLKYFIVRDVKTQSSFSSKRTQGKRDWIGNMTGLDRNSWEQDLAKFFFEKARY